MSTRRIGKALALTFALAACASPTTDDASASHDAIEASPRDTTDGVFDAEQVKVLVDFIDLSKTVIALKGTSFGNNNNDNDDKSVDPRDPPPDGGIPEAVTLQGIPSPNLVSMLFPGEVPPNPVAHAIDFRVPTFHGTEGQANGYSGWITEFRSTRMELVLEESTLRASFGIRGRFYLYHPAFLKPDFFIVVDDANATAHIGRDPGQTVLRSLEVNIDAHAEECGVVGICNFIVNRFLAKVSSQLQTAMTDKIREVLRDQVLQDKIVQALEKLDNVATDSDPPYSIDPASIRISGRAIRFKKHR